MPPVVKDVPDNQQNDEYPNPIVMRESYKIKEMSTEPVSLEDEFKKNPNLPISDIKELQEWIKTQPYLPQDITEIQLIMFHHSCYYRLEETKSCIKVYYSLRIGTPEYFTARDVSSPHLQVSVKALEFGVLPVRDPNGYQIINHRLKIYDASKYHFVEGVKLLAMAIDSAQYVDGTLPGYIFLFDMQGVKLTHLTRLSIGALRKFFLYVQEGLPARLKAIHVLNTKPLVDKIMLLIRPFMKKELINMIYFHGSDELEEVYKVLPKYCLPSDYGGDLPSCEKLHEHYIEWMKKLKPHFDEDELRFSVTAKSNHLQREKISIENEADINIKRLEID